MYFSNFIGMMACFSLLFLFLRAGVITLVAKRHVIASLLTEVGLYAVAFCLLFVVAKCVALLMSGISAYSIAWAQIVSV